VYMLSQPHIGGEKNCGVWVQQRKQMYTPLSAKIGSYNNYRWVEHIAAIHMLLFIKLQISLSVRKRVLFLLLLLCLTSDALLGWIFHVLIRNDV
jgi:uncharacterized membrane protein required for colicin V production